MIDGRRPLHVGILGDPTDRQRWFEELCGYYARQLGRDDSDRRSSLEEILGPTVPIGLVHIAALATVQREAAASTGRSVEDLLQILWKSQIASWERTRKDPDWGLTSLSETQVELAVLALLLLRPTDADAAVAGLRRLPELRERDEGTLRNIIDWARHLYPPTGASALLELEPHLISDAAFLRRAGAKPGFGRALLGSLTEAEAPRVWSCLVDAVPLLPAAAEWAAAVIGDDLEQLRSAVMLVIQRAPGDHNLDRQLARHVKTFSLTDDQVESLQRYISEASLPETLAELAAIHVGNIRNRVARDFAPNDDDLAMALLDLVGSLAADGDRAADAAEAAGESVALYRQLEQQEPEAYRPGLSGSPSVAQSGTRRSRGSDD